jgi:transcriptional regulator with XRE-family HTH domain
MQTPPEIPDRSLFQQRLPTPEDRRSIRRAAGLSTYDIAKHLGVTPAAVSAWEHGVTPGGRLIGGYVELLKALSALNTGGDQ